MRHLVAIVLAFAVGWAVAARAQDIASFEKRITVKVLPNGLTLIVCERPEAPVFSFYTLVNAGSADDPQGEGGLAHVRAHRLQGNRHHRYHRLPAEKVSLAKVETAYAAYDGEFHQRIGQGPAVASLKTAFDAAQAGLKYVIPNQFAELAEKNGAVAARLYRRRLHPVLLQYAFQPLRTLGVYGEQPHRHPVAREFYKETTLSGRAPHAH